MPQIAASEQGLHVCIQKFLCQIQLKWNHSTETPETEMDTSKKVKMDKSTGQKRVKDHDNRELL